MRYIDTGSRDPKQALGTWLKKAVVDDSSVVELRWQSGYFGAEILRYFEPVMAKISSHRGIIRVLVGSNDGVTRRADIEALLTASGSPRPGAEVGVVFFSNGYFHPKTVHVLRKDGSATAYVGSANLTRAGAIQNIEAGIILDTRAGDSGAILDKVKAAIDWWFSSRRPGLHFVATAADLVPLVNAGILDVPQPPRTRPVRGLARSRSSLLEPLTTLPTASASLRVKPVNASVPAGTSTPIRWTKKLSASDAQRKTTGNQRGSITLVQAGAAIDRKTFFRNVLFGGATWVRGATATGKPLETASIIFDVVIPRYRPRKMTLYVTHALNRESSQSNYTTLLHLGPLAQVFSAQDMTGRELNIERRADGTLGLTIT